MYTVVVLIDNGVIVQKETENPLFENSSFIDNFFFLTIIFFLHILVLQKNPEFLNHPGKSKLVRIIGRF